MRSLLAGTAVATLLPAVAALKVSEPPEKPWRPLSLRRGMSSDHFPAPGTTQRSAANDMHPLPFQNLQEVLGVIRSNLKEGFGSKSTIVNVGASFKDVDPIYELNLTESHPAGYNLIGYECDKARVPILAQNRPDVNIREMCVTGPSLVKDLQELSVESRFSLLKTDIDSVDGPVLDSLLGAFKPYVVYSEIMWDFAPPVEFSLVKVENGSYNPWKGGCFGMSLAMADHILKKNDYVLIEAAHANIMAVHQDVAHLFQDRPHDPWFWFQTVKSGNYHTHWMGAGRKDADKSTPLGLYGAGLGLYTEVVRGDGNDNFKKPAVQIRTMDEVMTNIASRVVEGCKLTGTGNHKFMLAVGDRCCAPQWGEMENCVCEFPAEAVDSRHNAA